MYPSALYVFISIIISFLQLISFSRYSFNIQVYIPRPYVEDTPNLKLKPIEIEIQSGFNKDNFDDSTNKLLKNELVKDDECFKVEEEFNDNFVVDLNNDNLEKFYDEDIQGKDKLVVKRGVINITNQLGVLNIKSYKSYTPFIKDLSSYYIENINSLFTKIFGWIISKCT